MIVDAAAAGTFLFSGGGELADVTKIIITPHEGDILRNFEAVLIQRENFFIRKKDLRDFQEVGVDVLLEKPALVGKDLLNDFDAGGNVARALHGGVMDAAHAKGPDVFKFATGDGSLFPVMKDDVAVGVVAVVPAAAVLGEPDIVLQHGFSMGSPHDDGVIIGKLKIFRIFGKFSGGRMHGGPEIIQLETEKKLKNFFIRLRADLFAVGIDGFSGPRLKAPVFIIDEDAAVLNGRRHGSVRRGVDVEGRLVGGRDVSPPDPGRYADLGGNIERPISRAPAIRADDDKRGINARRRMLNDHLLERFPFILNIGDIQFFGGDEGVDERGMAKGSDEDGVRRKMGGVVRDRGKLRGDGLNIMRQQTGGDRDNFEIGGIGVDVRRAGGVGEFEGVGSRSGGDKGGRLSGADDARGEEDGGEESKGKNFLGHVSLVWLKGWNFEVRGIVRGGKRGDEGNRG